MCNPTDVIYHIMVYTTYKYIHTYLSINYIINVFLCCQNILVETFMFLKTMNHHLSYNFQGLYLDCLLSEINK